VKSGTFLLRHRVVLTRRVAERKEIEQSYKQIRR